MLENQTVGLLADVVSDILTVSPSDLQPIPDIVDDTVRRFISGVLVIEDRMIRKMDLAEVLPSVQGEAV